MFCLYEWVYVYVLCNMNMFVCVLFGLNVWICVYVLCIMNLFCECVLFCLYIEMYVCIVYYESFV